MKKFLILILFAVNARAACPTGADYFDSSNNTLVTLASLGVTNCFYISDAGSDSNPGTKASPWAHVKGMPNCTANCLAHTPTAADGFIFKGGVAWHYGTSTAPAVGGTWSWSWSGSAGSPIYLGIDKTWYTGGSWARPIFNGDNATSMTAVGSCVHQTGGTNAFVSMPVTHYTIWDNFEWTGKCDASNLGFATNLYIYDQSTNHVELQHNYFHGWTHVAFNCPAVFCYASTLITGGVGSGLQTGDKYLFQVMDGSDSDPAGTAQMYDGIVEVGYSVFNNGSQLVGSYTHLFHDNLVENWVDPGDGVAHGNVFEDVSEPSSINAFYNNVFKNLYQTGITGVCFWIHPTIGFSDYVFNNIWDNAKCGGNFINIGQNSTDQGTYNLFNNLMESSTNGPIITSNPASSFSKISVLTNNQYITDNASAYQGVTQATFVTESRQTHAFVSSQGYFSANKWQPPTGSSYTVGAGTNRTAYCNTMLASTDPGIVAAGNACKNSTGYACTYNSSDHTVTCPNLATTARPSSGAWDLGPYEFVSGPPIPPPIPPTNIGIFITKLFDNWFK